MRAKFWLDLWQRDEIPFHRAEHNNLLVEFWPHLNLPAGVPVFVPMCGKSLDMRWLADAGHPVVGVEISSIAVESYFAESQESYEAFSADRFVQYRSPSTSIYQGDFFDLTSPVLEGIQGLFDRGALVALPADMRFRYVDHLLRIVPEQTKILLITLEYDQSLVTGPPHAIMPDEVERLFGGRCEIELLESVVTSALPPRFEQQGVARAAESVYLITKVD